jgi:hypothetical protein
MGQLSFEPHVAHLCYPVTPHKICQAISQNLTEPNNERFFGFSPKRSQVFVGVEERFLHKVGWIFLTLELSAHL